MADWGLFFVANDYRADSPQLFLDIDRAKIRGAGIPIASVFNTLQLYLGSLYVNNFNLFGRFWQVMIMADVPFRSAVKDLLNLKVANNNGQMVPLATLMNVRNDLGPVMMMRYNLYPAAAITGIPNIFESGSVLIDKVEQTARKQLPDNFS